jgi:hypothetical protein
MSLHLTMCGKVLRAEQGDPFFGLLPLLAIAPEEILVVSGMVLVENVDVAKLDCDPQLRGRVRRPFAEVVVAEPALGLPETSVRHCIRRFCPPSSCLPPELAIFARKRCIVSPSLWDPFSTESIPVCLVTC